MRTDSHFIFCQCLSEPERKNIHTESMRKKMKQAQWLHPDKHKDSETSCICVESNFPAYIETHVHRHAFLPRIGKSRRT